MTLENEVLEVRIECEADTANKIVAIFNLSSTSTASIVRPRHSHGDATNYYVLGMLAIKELPVILKHLKTLADALPIRSAEIGGDSIKFATAKQLETFLRKYSSGKSQK